MKKQNLNGQRFGRLTVEHEVSRPAGKKRDSWWQCLCDCGERKIAQSALLLDGRTRSCGCLRRELGTARGKASTKHGMEGTPEYAAWAQAKHRCSNPNNPAYERYGGRGIRMHPEWANSFQAFYDYVGPRPSPEYSLDRYPDNDGDYAPGNVRWATRSEQELNKTAPPHVRNQKLVSAWGKTMNIRHWANHLGIPEDRIQQRLARGMPPEQALLP